MNKSVISNVSHLTILQALTLLIPLATYPFLIRILGKETYGLVAFSQGVINYFLILVNFGFNISATKAISVHRGDNKKIGEIVSSVFIIKLLLVLLSLFLLLLLVLFIKELRDIQLILWISMAGCLGDLLLPVWYFQGIEKMKYITYVTLASRITFLSLIFLYINDTDDYILVPLINSVGITIAGILSLFIIFVKHRISFKIQPSRILKVYFMESTSIFISNVSVSLYVSTNKVLAGLYLGMEQVSYYDLAEKLTSVFKMPISILSQSLFPKISKEKDLVFVRKVFNLSLIFNLVLFLIVLIFSEYIITLFAGHSMLPGKLVFNVMAFTIPLVAISSIFGVLILIPFGYSSLFSRVVSISAIFYTIQMLILSVTFGFTILNIAIVTVITELFVTFYMYYYCNKLNLWKKNTII